MRKFLYGVILNCVCYFHCFSQSEYQIFKDSTTFNQEDTGKLILEIDNLNYLRNYEYFGKIPLSYTLFGSQLIPQIKYQVNPYFVVKAGIFLRREFGLNDFVSVMPVLTAKFQKKNLSFLIGTLEGSLNHRFIEPIYDLESIISDRIEQGTQLIINKKKIWLDWYIDWEKAIERYASYREEFTTGMSSRLRLISNERINLEIPLQIMLAHKGGQIDTSGLPVETLMNTAVGASFNIKVDGSFLKAIRTEHFFAYYKDLSGSKLQLYKEGSGVYSSLTFKTKYFDIDARYWNGNRFFGPRGGALYSSISEKVPGYGEKKRELIFLSFIYDKQLFPNVFIDLRLEPYYDIKNKFTEYAYSVFLRFKKDFNLRRNSRLSEPGF
jgi:hypothetical protein